MNWSERDMYVSTSCGVISGVGSGGMDRMVNSASSQSVSSSHWLLGLLELFMYYYHYHLSYVALIVVSLFFLLSIMLYLDDIYS